MSHSMGHIGFEMRHAGTQAMFEYWTALRAGRIAPYKAEIIARDMGRDLAGRSFVLENLGEGNIRFRLAGSALYDIFGIEVRGMSALSIIEQEDRARFRQLVDKVLSTPRIGLAECAAKTRDGETIRLEFIFAPLRSDFEQMNRVLGAVHVLEQPTGGVACASRRCSIEGTRWLDYARDDARQVDGPMAGFAEDQAGFAMDGPAGPAPVAEDRPDPNIARRAQGLTTIIGGAEERSEEGAERRRDHLRVVKD